MAGFAEGVPQMFTQAVEQHETDPRAEAIETMVAVLSELKLTETEEMERLRKDENPETVSDGRKQYMRIATALAEQVPDENYEAARLGVQLAKIVYNAQRTPDDLQQIWNDLGDLLENNANNEAAGAPANELLTVEQVAEVQNFEKVLFS